MGTPGTEGGQTAGSLPKPDSPTQPDINHAFPHPMFRKQAQPKAKKDFWVIRAKHRGGYFSYI